MLCNREPVPLGKPARTRLDVGDRVALPPLKHESIVSLASKGWTAHFGDELVCCAHMPTVVPATPFFVMARDDIVELLESPDPGLVHRLAFIRLSDIFGKILYGGRTLKGVRHLGGDQYNLGFR